MADHADHESEGDGGADHRVTAPMQEFDTGQVGVGLAVLLVGLVVTVGVPLALA